MHTEGVSDDTWYLYIECTNKILKYMYIEWMNKCILKTYMMMWRMYNEDKYGEVKDIFIDGIYQQIRDNAQIIWRIYIYILKEYMIRWGMYTRVFWLVKS